MIRGKILLSGLLCTILFGNLEAQNTLLLPVDVDGQTGYIDTSGTMVIAPQYDYGIYFWENNRALVSVNGQKRIIDTLGNFLSEPFEDLGAYPDPLNSEVPQWINAKKDGKWGFLDENFEEAVPFIYDEAEYFRDGFAIVRRKNKFGYLTLDGTFHELGKYDNVSYLGEGLLKVLSDSKEGVYSTIQNGMLIEPGDYYRFSRVTNGRLIANDVALGATFVLNTKGERIFEAEPNWFISLSSDSSDLIVVYDYDTEEYGIMTMAGEWIQKPNLKFDAMYGFNRCGDSYFNTFRIESEKGETAYGAINSQGEIIIEPDYQYLGCAHGYFFFTLKGKETEGLMDCDQNIVVPDIYTNVSVLNDEIAVIATGDSWDNTLKEGYLNLKTKKVIWAPSK